VPANKNTNHFADGRRCIVPVLRPKGGGWTEIPGAQRFTGEFDNRMSRFWDSHLVIASISRCGLGVQDQADIATLCAAAEQMLPVLDGTHKIVPVAKPKRRAKG
jgi:hypothetical protein